MDKGTVKVNYTIGDGNRIFQYMFARLLAHIHDAHLSTSALRVLGVDKNLVDYNKNLPIVKIGVKETDFMKYMENRDKANYLVHTYPEDYRIYKPYLNLIRGWFTDIPTTHKDDLVFHLRLGDRLLYRNEYSDGFTTVEDYIKAIKKFEYKRIYIVTDMKVWKPVSIEDLKKMRFHVRVPDNVRIEWAIAMDYFNSLYKGLSKLNPIVRVGYSAKEDFDFMRSFGQILFKHGTLAWWASVLSHAEKVGVFGPWRPVKGNKNKNLGQTNFDGWFQWGVE